MKNLNNRGFLLVETIVVATFTLTVLVALFIQFRNLVVSYNNSYNYNTVEGIYNLGMVKDYINQYQNDSNTLDSQLSKSSKPYLVIYNGSCNASLGMGDLAGFCENLMNAGNFKSVIFTASDPTELKEYVNNNSDSNISEEMRNLINRLDTVSNQDRLVAEFNDGTLATIVFGVRSYALTDSGSEPETPVKTGNTIKSWGLSSLTDFHTVEYKKNIVTITFLDNANVPSTAVESWDISEDNDGGVMAWVVRNGSDSSKYDLYIGSDGGVVANEDSSYLFFSFTALDKINFNNNFDTSNVTNMYWMFMSCTSLTNLDLSSFDTSNVTNMYQMFSACNKLTSLNLNGWNTSKVTNMMNLFDGCSSLTSLNLSSFNTGNVTTFSGMFMGCSSLTSLNLSSFNTSKATNMNYMFNGAANLNVVYVGSNWTIANASVNYMFDGSGISSVTRV